MKAYLYILGASSNPDRVSKSSVPCKVDENLIFFGPCKRRLRAKFYKKFRGSLQAKGEEDISTKEIYMVGFNGSNPQRERKIVWCGKVIKVMTFERAFNLMSADPRFKEFLGSRDSQLHLKPVYEQGKFLGYELRSNFHTNRKEWVKDVTSKYGDPRIEVRGKRLILKNPEERWDLLDRDACFLCENIFFAEGRGIEIDGEILKVLQEKSSFADKYDVFGKGRYLAGRWLLLEGDQAEKFVNRIKEKSSHPA